MNGKIFLWWDDGAHAQGCGLFEDRVSVVALVGDQMIGVDAFNQGRGLCAICVCTFCNKHSDRQTLRIHGQMSLGVEPPFVRRMS